MNPHIVQRAHELVQIVGSDGINCHTGIGSIAHELLHVVGIALLRIRLQSFLHAEIRSKLFDYLIDVGDGSHNGMAYVKSPPMPIKAPDRRL